MAVVAAGQGGVTLIPVWNQSHRERALISSEPMKVRQEADAAVRWLGWTAPYVVDAVHARRTTVAASLDACDGYHRRRRGHWTACLVQGFRWPRSDMGFLDTSFTCAASLRQPLEAFHGGAPSVRRTYLNTVHQAASTLQISHQHIGAPPVQLEVSMNETDRPQSLAD